MGGMEATPQAHENYGVDTRERGDMAMRNPDTRSQIEVYMDELNASIERLEKSTMALIEKIHPIIGPDMAEEKRGDDMANPMMASALRTRIQGQIDQIVSLTHRVNNIYERVEL